MTPLLSLIFLVLIAYIGAIFLHNLNTKSSIVTGINNSGITYLLLGYIIGPNALKIIDINVLNDLSLVSAFVLGWTGFIIGLQINVKQMLRFPQSYYWKTLLIFVISFVFLCATLCCAKMFIYNNLTNIDVVVLTIAGSISSPLLIGLLKKDYKIRGKLIHFLQFHSAYDNMVGIIIIGIMIFVNGAIDSEYQVFIINSFIIILGAFSIAILFYFTAKFIKTVPQYFLLIIGYILILVGTAIYVKQSTIFVSFLFGMILANLPINTWKLFQTISNTEKPIFLILLIFIGTRVSCTSTTLLLLVLIFIVLRFFINYGSTRVVIPGFIEFKPHIKTISYAGIGMGGLSLAFGLDYYLLNNYAYGSDVLFVLAVSYIINDTFSLKILEMKIKK